MPDIKSVISGLEALRDICNAKSDIAVGRGKIAWAGYANAAADAVILLKEQEPVEPYSMNAERTYGICPQCGKIIFRYGNVEENHYCGVCGKAVLWK